MSNALYGPLAGVAGRLGRFWWALLVAGVAWIVIGLVVLRFDTATVAVVSVVFGVLVLMSAAGEAFRAMVSTGGWRVWHLLFAVLLVIGAIVVFANPGTTFFSLALVIGFYFVVAGTFDIVSSLFGIGAGVHLAWLQLLSGVAQLVLGLLASSSLMSGVIVLVTWVSVSALLRGVAEIAAAFTIRALGNIRA